MFAPLGIHDSFKQGDLITTLTKGPGETRLFIYSKGISDTFPVIVRNAFICFNLAMIDTVLFLMLVPFMIISLIIYTIGGTAINRNEKAIWKAEKKLTSMLGEA